MLSAAAHRRRPVGVAVDPNRPARWVCSAGFVPALWGCVELVQGGGLHRERAAIMNWHRIVFAWAGLVVASRVGFQLAVASDLVRLDKVALLTNLGWAQREGVPSIPTLVAGPHGLKGFLLTKTSIRRFLELLAAAGIETPVD